MRMRTYVDAVIRLQHRRAHMVDEHERTDAARLQRGHGAADFQPADVVHAGSDQGGHGGGSQWLEWSPALHARTRPGECSTKTDRPGGSVTHEAGDVFFNGERRMLRDGSRAACSDVPQRQQG